MVVITWKFRETGLVRETGLASEDGYAADSIAILTGCVGRYKSGLKSLGKVYQLGNFR